MEQVGKFKLYSFDEVKDDIIGKIGSSERDEYERELKEELTAYKLGEIIKKARLSQNLTQEQLSEKVGINQVQISRLEKGKNTSIASLSRVFKALGFSSATIDVSGFGKLALW